MSDVLRGNEPFEQLLGDREFTVIDDMSDETYHSLHAYSASGAKLLLKSPAHFRYALENKQEQTPSMLLGTAVHMAILEPARFEMKAYPSKKGSGREKESVKEARLAEEERLRSQGFLILSEEQYEIAMAMRKAAYDHPNLPTLIEGHRKEVTILWRDPEHKIPCKSRLDVLRNDAIIVDLKTTTNAGPEAFGRTCAQYRYDLQAAVYNAAHEMAFDSSLDAFVFVAIENEPPFGIGIYYAESNVIARGSSDMDKTMLAYANALRSNQWHSYTPTIERLQFPAWALRERIEW